MSGSMELKNKAPYQFPHILARDKLQLKIIKLIRDWDLSKNKCPDAGKTSIYVKKNVEGVLRVCIKYGLFEEARMAAAYRRKPCLTTAEVEAVLEALLERYTPYSPHGAGGARYNR